MNDCCSNQSNQTPSCCPTEGRLDYIFILVSILSFGGYLIFLFNDFNSIPYLNTFLSSNHELLNEMWWGLALGIIFVGIVGLIPKNTIIKIIGEERGIKGIIKTTIAGVFFDLCSHGILLIGAKLYERGARLGQVMAFLIASPWNSFSLTFILWSLIGWKWTLLFIIFSMIIAIITGLIFENLVDKKILPENKNKIKVDRELSFKEAFNQEFRDQEINFKFFFNHLINSIKESKMILKWIFFGTIIASLIRTFVSIEIFQTYLGPSLIGLLVTLIVATVVEVCSEGSVPIAYDIFNRANAPGNSFTFLMAGVATDYTEILVLKETTKSLKIALFLPLITVPQVLIIAIIMNL